MDKKIVRFSELVNHKEEEKVFIGDILKERMQALDVSIDFLADEIMMEEEQIMQIIDNKISYDEIEKIDIELISQVLYCNPKYFISENARKGDILHGAMNRGSSDIKSNIVKGRLQQLVKDYVFLKGLMAELESGEQN